MNRSELRSFLESEAQKPFTGWDFSYLHNRIVTAPLEWSYPSLVLQRLRGARPPKSLLDMGTGGGEFFSTLHPFPPFTCATEAYPPNIPIARARLEPLGVQVFGIDEDDPALPFADQQFELIINRHEYYSPQEVARILIPGGTFITQQVGEQNDRDLVEMLGATPEPLDFAWNAAAAAGPLEQAGLVIERSQECFAATRIFDAGAVAYYFKAVPWEIPDFIVDAYFEALAAMHDRIEAEGYIETCLHRFLIVARKPV